MKMCPFQMQSAEPVNWSKSWEIGFDSLAVCDWLQKNLYAIRALMVNWNQGELVAKEEEPTKCGKLKNNEFDSVAFVSR